VDISSAMSGEPIAEAELLRLFEAARWAPSCANNQPWRFIYGLAQTPYFAELFNVLADGNKAWCKKRRRAGAAGVARYLRQRQAGGGAVARQRRRVDELCTAGVQARPGGPRYEGL
jgi:nitroreductase